MHKNIIKNFLTFYINKTSIKKIKTIIKKKKLRIFVKGGGCGGLKYGFMLVKKKNEKDFCIIKKKIIILIDSISFQYLSGSYLFYKHYLEESKFIIKNSNIKTTCHCGSSINFIKLN
ncbi:MAG: iron-sulfur cluster assembly accessory protein [Enterobacteriaceae bacterium PC38]|nr:MAG: iron-sulfur cluster assembly accessory protein [Enterobacteriaceae bacterium PC38]